MSLFSAGSHFPMSFLASILSLSLSLSFSFCPAPAAAQPAAPPPAPAPTWQPIPPLERRILGVLVEKQKTSKTADAYPLTLNALVTGCNQKTNRDPVTDLTDDEVEVGLSSLQK